MKKKSFIGSTKDWEIIRIKESDNNLSYFEKELFFALLSNEDKVLLSGLKHDMATRDHIKKMKKAVYSAVATKGWFSQDPEKARQKFVGIGIGIIFLFFFFGGAVQFFEFGGILIFSLIISAFLFFIFGRHMPQKTEEGALMKEKLEGFKMFLGVTEKDRAKFHFSPEAHPEKFAEYLPWAIVFEVEKEWAELFRGIDLPQPDWYQGNWSGMYSAMILSDSLGRFSEAIATTGVSAAASGGSGFGGGGSSGGGMGGGGGGSW